MSRQPLVRTATLDDLGAVRLLVQRAYEGYTDRIGRRPAPMDADYEVLLSTAERVFVVDDDAVAGVIVVSTESDHVSIDNVAVSPDAQGRGYGRLLMSVAERRARELGLPQVRLYTNAAMTENLAMYPRLGYVETDRRCDDGFDRVFFVKELLR